MVNIILQHTTFVLTALLLTSKGGVFYMYVYACVYVCIYEACKSETY